MKVPSMAFLLWTAVDGFVIPSRHYTRIVFGSSSSSVASLNPFSKGASPCFPRRPEFNTFAMPLERGLPQTQKSRQARRHWVQSMFPRFIICLALASAIWVTPAAAKGGGSHSHSTHSSSSSSRSRSSSSQSRSSSSTRSSSYHHSPPPRSSPPPPPRSTYKATQPKPAPARKASLPSYSSKPSISMQRSSPSTPSSPTRTTKKRVLGRVGGRARRPPTESMPAPPPTRYPSVPSVVPAPAPPTVIHRPTPTVHVYHSRPTILYRQEPIVVPEAYVSPIDTQPVGPLDAQRLSASASTVTTPSAVRHNPWPDRLWGGVVGAGMATAAVSVTGQTENLGFRHHKGIRNDSRSSTTGATTSVSASGWYRGTTTESDGTQQSVRVRLEFTRNGLVRGHGYDTEDGDYTISLGVWRDDSACWVEEYEDYQVLVYARRDVSSAKIKWKCMFVSSVDDITGDFEVEKNLW